MQSGLGDDAFVNATPPHMQHAYRGKEGDVVVPVAVCERIIKLSRNLYRILVGLPGIPLHRDTVFSHGVPFITLCVSVPFIDVSRALSEAYTEKNKKACTWLQEFCSCSCLTALPGLAWVLLSKIYIPFFPLCNQN